MSSPDDHNYSIFIADTPGERLDAFAARASGESRSRIQKLIESGDVLVNGQIKKLNYKLSEGEKIELVCQPPVPLDILPEDIRLEIVYEDEDIAVINKAQGMVVHPAPGNYTGTLVNALLFSIKDLSGIGGVIRPGIVHRIDKMTSGLLVVAKNDAAHLALCAQLETHDVKRNYLAIVEGNIKEEYGSITGAIGRHPLDRKRMAVTHKGKDAVTNWRVLFRMGQYTLIEAALTTGRTHQIRVHMAYTKHPVAGDTVYGQSKPRLGLEGQALHAYKLAFAHPGTNERMYFYAPPPIYFLGALEKAGWDGKAYWEET